jgi:hypothetical protein
MVGTGIQYASPAELLCLTAGELVGCKLGHKNQGLGLIIWIEVDPTTSIVDGHHDYTNHPGCGTDLAELVRDNDLGVMSLGNWGLQDHGSTSSLRAVTWSPIGPLEELDAKMEKVFGDEYTRQRDRYTRNSNQW